MKKIIIVLLLIGYSAYVFSNSPLNEMINNNEDSFIRKMNVLEMNFSELPLLSIYLQNCSDIRMSMIEALIDNGADVNISDDSGIFPIHYAIARNNLTVVRLLIENGANIYSTIPLGAIESGFYSSDFSDGRFFIRGDNVVTSKELAFLLKRYDIYDIIDADINLNKTINVYDSDDNFDEGIKIIELPLWSKMSKINSESLKFFCKILDNLDEVPSFNGMYDPIFISILNDDEENMRRILFSYEQDSKKLINFAILFNSYNVLDLLMRFNNIGFESFIPMGFDQDLTMERNLMISIEEDDYVPMYTAALLLSDLNSLEYLIENGADLHISFKATSFDRVRDIHREYRYQPLDLPDYINLDEDVMRCIRNY
ncbi:MAG: ankyrin repeat domain-containing protein [Spirochaetales bacterium]|nr:ankyrin repeat domain-containing protein [Spirochaetales bacterium]